MPPKRDDPPGAPTPNGPKKSAARHNHTSPQDPPQLEAARFYLQRSWWLFAVDAHTKQPLTSRRRNGYNFGASNAPAQIESYFREFPDAAVGVATGRSLIVIDFDTKEKHGADGMAAFEVMRQMLPPTLTARTPSGGRHLYCKMPPDLDMYISNSASKILPGVDVRGSGGYVIAPSVLRGPDPTGRQWITSYDHPIAELDEEMITGLGGRRNDRPGRQVRSKPTPPSPPHPVVALMLEDAGKGVSSDTYAKDDVGLKICCALSVISADCSEQTWFEIGAGIHAALGSAGLDLFDEWSASAPHRYPGGASVAEKYRHCGKMRSYTERTVYGFANKADRRWLVVYRDEMRGRS